MEKYTSVDEFLASSGRWRAEAKKLCVVLKKAGLTGSIKWGKPCFSHEGSNIAILQPMKDFLALMFFKGALIDDPAGLLQEQGENTRSARRLCFVSVQQIKEQQATVQEFVHKAIAVEREGKQLPAPRELVLVAELQDRLNRDKKLKAAFERLTPGRQREYHLNISSAKQSTTRTARVDKHAARILAGKGLRDR